MINQDIPASITASVPTPSKRTIAIGWVLTILPAGMLLMSATMKFLKPPEVLKSMEPLGLPSHIITPLGLLEVCCTILYLIPKTAVLGAILLTGYLGGAILTHLRVGDQFIAPAILGIVLWFGLFLREPRLRMLIPLRSGR